MIKHVLWHARVTSVTLFEKSGLQPRGAELWGLQSQDGLLPRVTSQNEHRNLTKQFPCSFYIFLSKHSTNEIIRDASKYVSLLQLAFKVITKHFDKRICYAISIIVILHLKEYTE
jgi:hypothetical protein